MKLLVSRGLSHRKARKAVQIVFDAMANALARGECVEAPGGLLQLVDGRPRRDFRKTFDLKTDRVRLAWQPYRQRHPVRIDFQTNLELPLLPRLHPLCLPPGLPRDRELIELVSSLLGRQATGHELAELKRCMKGLSLTTRRVKKRLKHLQQRVVPPINIYDLCDWIRSLYWIKGD